MVQAVKDLNLLPVVVKKDVPGFVENRILYAIMREACDLVENGVIEPEGLDTCVSWGIGYKLAVVGPMSLLDMAGLDIYQAVGSYLNADLCNRADVSGYVTEKTGKGELGMKTGTGIFSYTPDDIKALQGKRAGQLVAVRRALEGTLLAGGAAGGGRRWPTRTAPAASPISTAPAAVRSGSTAPPSISATCAGRRGPRSSTWPTPPTRAPSHGCCCRKAGTRTRCAPRTGSCSSITSASAAATGATAATARTISAAGSASTTSRTPVSRASSPSGPRRARACTASPSTGATPTSRRPQRAMSGIS